MSPVSPEDKHNSVDDLEVPFWQVSAQMKSSINIDKRQKLWGGGGCRSESVLKNLTAF
jgi:hypothetical protein